MNLKVNIDNPVIEQDIEQISKESIIKFGDRIEKPDPLINYMENDLEYTYLTRGGISGILGEQKSRKTFYTTIQMSAAISPYTIDGKLKGYGHNLNHLYFDTEQSRYYAAMIPYRIVKKLSINSHPENLTFVSIKKYSTEDRIKIIDYFIRNTENLGLVLIDGVRDLVHDFNNLGECTDLLNLFLNWTDTKNCHISVVLHINPGTSLDRKPRGHLGTELQNKVESSVLVSKNKEDKSMSIIEPRDFRSQDISRFGLKIDGFGIPFLIDDDNIENVF